MPPTSTADDRTRWVRLAAQVVVVVVAAVLAGGWLMWLFNWSF